MASNDSDAGATVNVEEKSITDHSSTDAHKPATTLSSSTDAQKPAQVITVENQTSNTNSTSDLPVTTPVVTPSANDASAETGKNVPNEPSVETISNEPSTETVQHIAKETSVENVKTSDDHSLSNSTVKPATGIDDQSKTDTEKQSTEKQSKVVEKSLPLTSPLTTNTDSNTAPESKAEKDDNTQSPNESKAEKDNTPSPKETSEAKGEVSGETKALDKISNNEVTKMEVDEPVSTKDNANTKVGDSVGEKEKSSLLPSSPLAKSSTTTPKPVATIKPMIENTSKVTKTGPSPTQGSKKTTDGNNAGKSSNKRQLEGGDEPDKRLKQSPSTTSGNKEETTTGEQDLEEYMAKTFDQRRKIITKQMPAIPELKSMYPELFMGKQLLEEFERITKINIDQKIQEFCVRYATAVIEMARNNKAAAPVLARWQNAKQENETLKKYWDMVTALCLLPLHFGENFVEMVLEIGEDEEVKAQGKIVPTLVARGNIFRTDEFFLIAENTIVQEFEEFTIAFASLYSSYWVFNMVYPETIENTYNYIQRCIVRQREPGATPAVCKNFTKALQKWNKDKKKESEGEVV